jgi:hypothetical protein
LKQSRSRLEQLQQRRSEVTRYRIRGYSSRQIASFMNYSQSTILRDERYIDNAYLKESEDYIRRLPAELRRIRLGVNEVLQLCWTLADDNKLDPKIRLQAAALANDSYRLYAELSDGSIDVDKLSSMLARTKDKADDIADIKKQEQPVF